MHDLARPNKANLFTQQVWGWRPDTPCYKGKRLLPECKNRPGRFYYQVEADRYHSLGKQYGLDPIQLARDEFKMGREYTQEELLKMSGKDTLTINKTVISEPMAHQTVSPVSNVINTQPVSQPVSQPVTKQVTKTSTENSAVNFVQQEKEKQQQKENAAFWLTGLSLLFLL